MHNLIKSSVNFPLSQTLTEGHTLEYIQPKTDLQKEKKIKKRSDFQEYQLQNSRNKMTPPGINQPVT